MLRIGMLLVIIWCSTNGVARAQDELPDDLVLVSGEGFKITVKDFREYLNSFEPLSRHRSLTADTIRMIVDNLANTEAFAAYAERAELKGLDKVKREVREAAARQLVLSAKEQEKKVSDEEVKKYFDAHPDRFLQGELRRASVILVKDKAAAEALAKKAAKADTKGFAELARSNSVNVQTRMRGGDLRYFNRDGIPLQLLSMYAAAPEQAPKDSNVDPAIVAAAFALDTVGQTSPVTEVGENFAIVRLTGKREPQFKTWKEAAPHIRTQLRQEHGRSSAEELVARLRKEQEVKVSPKPLEDFVFKETPRTPVVADQAEGKTSTK